MSAAPDPLTIILLTCVFLVLSEILRALSAGTLLCPPQPRRRIEFDGALFGAATFFILFNVIPVLVQRFLLRSESAAEKPVPTSLQIELNVVFNFLMIAALVAFIVARRKNRLADYGIDVHGWLAEMRYGGLAFLACLPFVIAIIVLISRWRSPDTQNSLLILLRQTGSERTVWEVVLAAAVSAPLAEEMLFRVAFQGSLEARLPLAWAIGIPAVVFAGVHGPYDALPLLPLALALGCVYHFRRSYVAVVTTHALFNATFLILALAQKGGA
jgi:membrane protease YdiL (CAAX protease family)